MADASFPCRNNLGRALRDRISITGLTSGLVSLTASRNDGAESISVHLTPEDILQFAAEALKVADLAAERQLP